MQKRIIAIIGVVILLASMLVACGKAKGPTISASNGMEYLLATDTEGNTVVNGQGELAIYVIDSNGKYVTQEDGEKQTNYITFPNKVIDEKGAKIETPLYIIEMPEKEWKIDSEGNIVYKANEKIAFEQPVYSPLNSGRTIDDVVNAQVDALKKLQEEEAFKGRIKFTTEPMKIKLGDKEYFCVLMKMEGLDENKKTDSIQHLYYIQAKSNVIQVSFICHDKNAFDTVDDLKLLESGLTIK